MDITTPAQWFTEQARMAARRAAAFDRETPSEREARQDADADHMARQGS